MFLYKSEPTTKVQAILDESREKFGIVPPHWELLATISPKRFEIFMQEIGYLLNHQTIERDFFSFLRFYIANYENFLYCKSFNTKLLLAKGYTKEILKLIKEDISNIPLDEKHKVLAKKAIKAIYDADNFTLEDIDILKKLSWSDADIYDAIDHAAFLFKFSKIIKAYQA